MRQRRNEYEAMRETVVSGTAYGLRRWYKHRDDEPENIEEMAEFIAEKIMDEVAADWEFEDDE